MKHQRGYYMSDSGFTGCLIIAIVAASLVGGWLFYVALPWAWEQIRPWLHQVTT